MLLVLVLALQAAAPVVVRVLEKLGRQLLLLLLDLVFAGQLGGGAGLLEAAAGGRDRGGRRSRGARAAAGGAVLVEVDQVRHRLGVGVVAGKRVRVDPRVPGQLVRAGEALEAPGEVALVGLFARVCSDVAGLVLEPVERLLAQRTLVGPGLRRRRRRRAAAGRRGGLGVVCSGHAGCAAGLLWGRGCSAAGALADGPGQHAKRGTLLAADCFWVSPGTHGGLCTPPAVHRHHHPVFWIPRASSQARCNRHNPTLRKRLALPLPLAFSRPRLPLVFSPGARNEEKGGGKAGASLRRLT